MTSDLLQPVLEAQQAWKPMQPRLNPEMFLAVGRLQEQIASFASDLAKSFDFGVSDAVIKAAAQFAARHAIWLENLGPTVAAFHASFYPENLREIEDLDFEDVEHVVMVEGIPLYGVPRTEIALALIRASDQSQRRDILGRRWKAINADCRALLAKCDSDESRNYVTFALAALEALDDGHTQAAQALAGSVIDALLNSYFGSDRSIYTPDAKGERTTEAYEAFSAKQFIAFSPVWQSYQKFFPSNGDNVPHTFSRNATAHTVSPRQFNRRNAVQGVMVACSLLYRIDQELAIKKQ